MMALSSVFYLYIQLIIRISRDDQLLLFGVRVLLFFIIFFADSVNFLRQYFFVNFFHIFSFKVFFINTKKTTWCSRLEVMSVQTCWCFSYICVTISFSNRFTAWSPLSHTHSPQSNLKINDQFSNLPYFYLSF